MEEYYLHFAGLKEEFELEKIYARYADLTDIEQVTRIGAAVDGDQRVRELWKFSCEGFLGALTPPVLFSINSLLFVLVAAEMLRCGSQIVLYRLGA